MTLSKRNHEPVEIIAEAGVNHNGSLRRAIELIDAAADSGADVVKFQTFKASALASKKAAKAEYQKRTSGAGESQLSMLQKLELNDDEHAQLIEHCGKRKIEFLSTPFDPQSLDLLTGRFKLRRLKFSSGDLTNAPLLHRGASAGVDVIISSGMSTLDEIRDALSILAFAYLHPQEKPSRARIQNMLTSPAAREVLARRVSLLHCTSEYPAPFAEINLRVIPALRDEFGLRTGLSDHSQGISVPIAAVSLGARVIEKHFTLDRALPGPDHQASLEPDELKDMVRSIREVESALGDGVKAPAPSEMKNITIARKSLVAARTIRKGDLFSAENLTIKRPGNGISPLEYWDYLGKRAERDFEEDDIIV